MKEKGMVYVYNLFIFDVILFAEVCTFIFYYVLDGIFLV